MKRTIALVSYASSDEEEERSADGLCQAASSCKRKLPKLSPSLTLPRSDCDLARHQGRTRTTPHVEGQFAAFVFVPVPLKKNAALRELLDTVIHRAMHIEPSLVCDWQGASPSSYSLHVSLTRPIYLRHYQREDLRRAIKAIARTVRPFTASFSTFAKFDNDERTRTFLGVEIGAGHSELEILVKTIEPTLKLLHQKEFYSEPQFHASIAWALLRKPSTSQVDALGTETSLGEGAQSLPRAIRSFAPSLIPDVNALFRHSLSNINVGAFEVDRVSVKIGKEISSWTLGGEQ